MLLSFTHKTSQASHKIIESLEAKGPVKVREQTIHGSKYVTILLTYGNNHDVKYIINSPVAILNSLDSIYFKEVMAINGIFSREMIPENTSLIYNVLVFERSTVSIKQRPFGKNSVPIKYVEESQCRKVADLCKRVIYLLGLDYGMVNVSVTNGRKITVLGVDPSPAIRDKELAALIRKLYRTADNIGSSPQKEIKIGADPEFMLANTRNGKMIPASQFFPRDGVIGCDNIRVPNRQQRPVAELRPKPDPSPLQVVANLKDAMRTANRIAPYRNVKWIAGSRPFNGFSIGGHIHFSNIDLNNHILRALDNYLGLPLFLIENQATAVKRRTRYGFLADFRIKDYGGFEYRTPGSWLVTPEITSAALCLSKIVTANYLQLNRNCFANVEAQRAFYEGDQDFLRVNFVEIWTDIQKTELYNTYHEQVQIIFNMIMNNVKWNEKEDIRKTWGIIVDQGKKNDFPGPLNIPSSLDNEDDNQSLIPASNNNRDRVVRNHRANPGPSYSYNHVFNR